MTLRTVIALCAVLSSCHPLTVTRVHAAATDSAPVLVRGRVIARLYTPNAGATPAQRAALATKRLTALGDRPLAATEIETRPLKQGVGLYLCGQLLLAATPAEAASRDLAPQALADRWATLLRTVLCASPPAKSEPTRARPDSPLSRSWERGAGARASVTGSRTATTPTPPPALRISESSLTLPLGESRVLTATGTGGAPLVETTAPEVIEARLEVGKEAGKWLLHLRGLSAGRAAVRPRSPATEGASGTPPTAELRVQVMPYAARPRESVEATITGRPAPEAWSRRQAEARREEALLTEPGARVRWQAEASTRGELAAGESRTFTWSARVTAPGCLPVTLRPAVVLRNRALPERETALLLYSNNPERVTAPGLLYAAPLDDDIPARLLYHHQNGSGRPFTFRVELENENAGPAEVQVIEGTAGPTLNTVLVGHLAARRYGENWPSDLGVVHTIAAGGRLTLVRSRVPDGDTVSGILNLRCLSGGRLRARVLAEEEGTPAASPPAGDAARPTEGEGTPPAAAPASDHIYAQPRKEVAARYRVGETWAFIPVGKKPIAGRDGRRLEGNYGVLYDITVRVENPTDRERTIQVAFSADAGPARGIFWIDDRFIEAPEWAGGDGLLASFRIGPGELRDVPIRTIPVAGSFYPARIVVRAAPLPPTTPAAEADKSLATDEHR